MRPVLWFAASSQSPEIENVISHCDFWLILSIFIPLSYLYFCSVIVAVRDYENKSFQILCLIRNGWHNVKILYLFAFYVQMEMSLCQGTLFLRREQKVKKERWEGWPKSNVQMVKNEIFIFSVEFGNLGICRQKNVQPQLRASLLLKGLEISRCLPSWQRAIYCENCHVLYSSSSETLQNEPSVPHKPLRNGEARSSALKTVKSPIKMRYYGCVQRTSPKPTLKLSFILHSTSPIQTYIPCPCPRFFLPLAAESLLHFHLLRYQNSSRNFELGLTLHYEKANPDTPRFGHKRWVSVGKTWQKPVASLLSTEVILSQGNSFL